MSKQNRKKLKDPQQDKSQNYAAPANCGIMSASLAVAAAVSRTPFTQRRFVVARPGLQIIMIILIIILIKVERCFSSKAT